MPHDTLSLSNGRVSGGVVYGSPLGMGGIYAVTFAYDKQGNQTLETHTEWDSASQSWGQPEKTRYVHSYDNDGLLVGSVRIDSSDSGWNSPEMSARVSCTYSRGDQGQILSRIDSSFYNGKVEQIQTHYFQYRSFESASGPGIVIPPEGVSPLRISSSGLITADKGFPRGWIATLYCVSGKVMFSTRLEMPFSVWNYCVSHGIQPARGAYVLIVNSGQGTIGRQSIKLLRN